LKPGEPQQDDTDSLVLCVLASGSKGNSIFISDGSASLLIDAGLSGIEIERRLKFRGLSPENLDAIIVSHEHSDHIQGVGVLSRRFNLPVYLSHKTNQTASSKIGCIHKTKNFECGTTFDIKNFKIHPFSISHDAEDPAGFTIEQNKRKIGIATDLGIATAMVKEHLKGCDLLVLEANHDPDMLANGPYPWPLKQRIKGRTGHLSNRESKDLLMEVKAHLSEKNNTPEKALNIVGQALNNSNTRLSVATQYTCSNLLHIGP
jgi:phosphoribosyl 1,2-cyclic phosphodiesterase